MRESFLVNVDFMQCQINTPYFIYPPTSSLFKKDLWSHFWLGTLNKLIYCVDMRVINPITVIS